MQMVPRPDWIFFDMDGTLANSLPALRSAYFGFLNSFGHQGTDAEFGELNGPSLPEIIRILKERYGLESSREELFQAYSAQMTAAYGHAAEPMPGAAEILFALKTAGYRLMLTTSAMEDMAMDFLSRQGWEDLFDDAVFGDLVARSKPFPDLYQLAVERSGAGRPLVIEDSVNGVRSASGAGLTVIGCSASHAESLLAAGAKHCISSLLELKAFLLNSGRFTVLSKGPVVLRNVRQDIPIHTGSRMGIIEEIWQAELAKSKGRLFNGQLFCYANLRQEAGTTLVEGGFDAYKHYVAHYHAPELGLNMTPMGVSGVCLLADGKVALARRTQTTQYDGYWEFAPSGSIDAEMVRPDTPDGKVGTVEVRDQLIAELVEETGIQPGEVGEIRPLGLVKDDVDQVIDVCFALRITMDSGAFLERVHTGEEYSEWKVLSLPEAATFVERSGEIVPITEAILKLLLEG